MSTAAENNPIDDELPEVPDPVEDPKAPGGGGVVTPTGGPYTTNGDEPDVASK